MHRLTACVCAALLSACSESPAPQPAPAPEAAAPKPVAVIVDVPRIAGQPPEAVAQLLGQPTSCEDVKHGRLCVYDKGGTEVVYIDGVADWITVGAMAHVPFDDTAIQYLGFPAAASTFSTADQVRWSGTHGMQLIQLAPGYQGTVFYAHIKARTP